MVLKTLHAMGALHGYAIARRIEQVPAGTEQRAWERTVAMLNRLLEES